ncbi:MAG: 1-deoxy-D-xylulose-5-phosphate reductoisomerase [Pseudomonadota bacterium]
MQGVCVLGATGSIGRSTLDVLRRHPQRWRVESLGADRDVDGMLQACREFHPRQVAMADAVAAERLSAALRALDGEIEVLSGAEGMEAIAGAPESPVVVAAIVGAAGLRPALAAVRRGKRVLLANKEALVMSGALFMDEVQRHGATLLPLDSEHNALFQCLPRPDAAHAPELGVRELILTASGGPFRAFSLDRLARVTPDEACAHPNWSMGRKISVDSASLMNKGLEVIEAHWLFDVPPSRIRVLVHPQSIVHSLVSYSDGSVLAQMGQPDMRTPIAHALAWPERVESGVPPLDLATIASLAFEPPDTERFPCLRLAFEALRQGGVAPAALNAANEIAVEGFLARRMRFIQIPRLIEDVLGNIPVRDASDLTRVFEADADARAFARDWLERYGEVI